MTYVKSSHTTQDIFCMAASCLAFLNAVFGNSCLSNGLVHFLIITKKLQSPKIKSLEKHGNFAMSVEYSSKHDFASSCQKAVEEGYRAAGSRDF